MAAKLESSKKEKVYLGFIDEPVTTVNENQLNYCNDKVGGLPNWCQISEHPTCGECNMKTVLVMQIYAPLIGSPFHRTLYIFACLRPSCWNKPGSWICLRSQVKESSSACSTNNSQDDWMEGEDDWSIDTFDAGNKELNGFSNNDSMNINNRNVNDFKLCVKNEDFFINNLNPGDQIENNISRITDTLNHKMNLNNNVNEEGAIANISNNFYMDCVDMNQASAFIEGPEGESVNVETPDKCLTNILELFKQKKVEINISSDEMIKSYFIDIELEPKSKVGISDHERELVLEYKNNFGHETNVKTENKDQTGNDCSYVKGIAKHGDNFLQKFKKRISRSPQQIVRYSRDEISEPLWLQPPDASLESIKCRSCLGPMIFEVQIMPQLIPFLVLSKPNPDLPPNYTVLEFGTVIIYTCKNSCWNEKTTVCRELCVAQSEHF